MVTMTGSGMLSGGTFFDFIKSTAGTVTLGSALTVGRDLTISAGTLDVSTSNFGITVARNWSNSGVFTARAGTVTLSTTALAQVTGTTSFYNLRSQVPGKTIQFQSGATQTIAPSGSLVLEGMSGNNIVLQGTAAATWNLAFNGASYSVAYATINYSTVISGNPLTASYSTDGGTNNPASWTFPALRTWTGLGGNNNWGTPANWLGNAVPGVADDARIPGGLGTPYPRLAGSVNVASLDLQNGASIDMNGNNLSTSEGILIGGTVTGTAETISAGGNVALQSSAVLPAGLTMQLAGAAKQLSSAVSLGIMRISGTVNLQSNISVSGDVTVDVGSALNLNGYTLAVSGGVVITGSLNVGTGVLTVAGSISGTGTLNGGSGTVTVTGSMGVIGTPFAAYSATSGITRVGTEFNVSTFTHNSGTVILDTTTAATVTGRDRKSVV